MCLLSIASRHHEDPSHNLLTLHHSKVIERHLPASSLHEIHARHGTRVTVRNLFGNLPVRVKQRGVAAEQKTEQGRLWDVLRRETTGLALSWRKPVSLRIRDADSKTSISLSTGTPSEHRTRTCSPGLHPLLNVLTQAGYIPHEEWPSWVPVSASTSTTCIKGAISLDPAPSKRVQFISLGVAPLSADNGHNELYDEINRLFAMSSFGTIEHDANVDLHEKIRRQSDNRFKSNGYTNRQLKARKGVDRYPKFHLRMSLAQIDKYNGAATLFDHDEANLSTVMDMLKAMITEWLAVHHFRPRKYPFKYGHRPPSAASPKDTGSEHDASSGHQTSQLKHPQCSTDSSPPISTLTYSLDPRMKSLQRSVPRQTERKHQLAFSEWSRIKSGNATLGNDLNIKRDAWLSTERTNASASLVQESTASKPAKFETAPVHTGSLDCGDKSDDSERVHDREKSKYDEAIPWTDPTTKQTYFLNARTGCVLSRLPARPQTDPLPKVSGGTLSDFNKSIRLRPISTSSNKESNDWLKGVLTTWDNPVFKPAEARIQQAPALENQHNDNCKISSHFGNKETISDDLANTTLASIASKLSRNGLRNAEVMAQLDKKFILAKMKSLNNKAKEVNGDRDILILIDQHAADERLRVEALLTELCAPLPTSTQGYRTKLGHQSHVAFTMLDQPIRVALSAAEKTQFVVHAARFAAWGILFDVTSTNTTRPQSILSVTALPPVIFERCKADPQVLITLLRTAVWKYADAIHLPPPIAPAEWDESLDNREAWVRRISDCPEGLIDLVNSRACRSAIMFNDELSIEECRELVRKLCGCVFPFMCAHGRPSMVPLIDMGSAMNLETAVGQEGGHFVTAWKQWQKR